MDYVLLECIDKAKQKLINKYLFSCFDMHLSDDSNHIVFWFQHSALKDNEDLVDNILNDFIASLNINGYPFIHDKMYPTPLRILDDKDDVAQIYILL